MLKQIVSYIRRTAHFIWFMRTYWSRQFRFNLQVFRVIVVRGQDLATVKTAAHEEELVTVNRYHTRYEGTIRAAI